MKGTKGLARIMASIIAAIPYVIEELGSVEQQRIVEVALLSGGVRHQSFVANRENGPYPYWRP